MTRRERLRRCFFHEPTDRPAVYVRTGFPGHDPTYDELQALLAAHSELKRPWNTAAIESDDPTDRYREPAREDFERRVITLHTPAGDLRRTDLMSLKGLPGMEEEYFLKSREDAETYLSLPMPELAGDVDEYRALDAEMGDAGIVDAALGMNPGGFVADLFGSEAFAILSITDRDILHALCERRMQILLNRLEVLLDRGVGPYFSMLGEEYIVPPLHGPADFADFNIRYDRAIIERIHAAGGRIHVHCHGSIKTVLPGFVEAGVDVLHPFEAPPMGDVTPAEAAEMARGKLCLEGNLQIADMYESTPEDIAKQTAALIETCFDDNTGLIVCPTASPYVRGEGAQCFPMFKAMIDTVLNWSG